MIFYVTLSKTAAHTVTIRVEAVDRANAEGKAVGVGVRNPTCWDSVVEGEPVVTEVIEGDDASA
jgi:hypothetical protein